MRCAFGAFMKEHMDAEGKQDEIKLFLIHWTKCPCCAVMENGMNRHLA